MTVATRQDTGRASGHKAVHPNCRGVQGGRPYSLRL